MIIYDLIYNIFNQESQKASHKRYAILGVIFLLHFIISFISNLVIPIMSDNCFWLHPFTSSASARYSHGWNANPGLIMILCLEKVNIV